MSEPWSRENWASDFSETMAFAALPAEAREHAELICEEFLKHAGEFSEAEIQAAFFDHLTLLPVPARPHAPQVVAAFLGSLEEAGRLAGGKSLGLYAAALAEGFEKRCAPGGGSRGVPIQAAPKIGRNDPCPCGSGKKHKKCCGV